jgi:catechol 2,3-dioxygenase-like lactoylglutathione lyase family enzyme
MALKLSHVNLPARDPEALARWYADQLGFERRGAFLLAAGTLIVFEAGEPVPSGKIHFGFRVHAESDYAGIKVEDPEHNIFEIYWEPGH